MMEWSVLPLLALCLCLKACCSESQFLYDLLIHFEHKLALTFLEGPKLLSSNEEGKQEQFRKRC